MRFLPCKGGLASPAESHCLAIEISHSPERLVYSAVRVCVGAGVDALGLSRNERLGLAPNMLEYRVVQLLDLAA